MEKHQLSTQSELNLANISDISFDRPSAVSSSSVCGDADALGFDSGHSSIGVDDSIRIISDSSSSSRRSCNGCRHSFNDHTLELHTKVAKLQMDVKNRDCITQALKAKIRDQYVELENRSLEVVSSRVIIRQLELNVKTLQKSENWFRGELHAIQASRITLEEKLRNLTEEKAKVKIKCNWLEQRHVEMANQCKDNEKTAVQMQLKEKRLRTLSLVEPNQCSTASYDKMVPKTVIDEERATRVLRDLNNEIVELNGKLQHSLANVQKLEYENTNLKSLNSNRAKELAHNACSLAVLTAQLAQLSNEQNLRTDMLMLANRKVRQALAEKKNLLIQQKQCADEKSKIDGVILKLRKDFEIISNRFNEMRDILQKRELNLKALQNCKDEMSDKLQSSLKDTHRLQARLNELENCLSSADSSAQPVVNGQIDLSNSNLLQISPPQDDYFTLKAGLLLLKILIDERLPVAGPKLIMRIKLLKTLSGVDECETLLSVIQRIIEDRCFLESTDVESLLTPPFATGKQSKKSEIELETSENLLQDIRPEINPRHDVCKPSIKSAAAVAAAATAFVGRPDLNKVITLLQSNAKCMATLDPLVECVALLRDDMDTLSAFICGKRMSPLSGKDISLMEELQYAESH